MSVPRRIAIVGSDCHAWLAAAALKRAFRHLDIDILVIEEERPQQTTLGRWTLPSLRGTHALMGVKEAELVARTGATFKLATEHHGWQSERSRYVHAHGEIGSELQGIAFYKYLLLQAALGRHEPIEDYSLAALAARMGRFARPMSHSALTSSFTYGFHLDEAAYTTYLREHAEKLGVRRHGGRISDVLLRDDGSIAAVQLDHDVRVAADFYIDCSGCEPTLITQLSSEARIDWSAWLLNDRVISMRAAPVPEARAVTETSALDGGWMWRIPLARSSVVGLVYSSAFLADAQAVAHLQKSAPGVEGQAVRASIAQGRRRNFWERNCLALGDAAVQLEPLVGANLHLTQLGIAIFIEMFPLGPTSRLEAIEYNHIIGEHADALRDFTIAHYRAGRTRAGEYWAATQAAPLPERLAARLDLYRAAARLNLLDNETFEEADWAWVLLGTGCTPDTIGLHVRSTLERTRLDDIATLRESIRQLAASMPRHMDFVRQHG